MTRSDHPAPEARIRYALWGRIDDRTDEVSRHLVADECGACTEEIETLRAGREALGALVSPPAALLDRVRLRGRAPEERGESAQWVPARPARRAAGVRAGVATDRQLVCQVGEHHLDVLLHPVGADGAFAVSGQVVAESDLPARALTVTLFVDETPAATTRTNGFGEFEFDEHRGRRFGVRVGEGASAAHVALWTAEGLR